jgi:hypothetical protein
MDDLKIFSIFSQQIFSAVYFQPKADPPTAEK